MGVKVTELQLIEGRKNFRDKYVSRTEVLDRVKELSLLPYKETATTEMVAKFYEVSIKTIESVVEDNREELLEDGYNVLKSTQLKDFKAKFLVETNPLQGGNLNSLKYARQIAFFPRRAILRVGMLLRDSPVAKQVRTYLLNTEEISTSEQKQLARESNWTSKDDMVILNSVVMTIVNGGTLTQGIQIAGKKLNKSINIVYARWYYKVRENVDEKILQRIKENRGRGYEKSTVSIVKENSKDNSLALELGYKIDAVRRENCTLVVKNSLLEKDNDRLKHVYKKLKTEYDAVMNIIGQATKNYIK